jgi:hypothetical protein
MYDDRMGKYLILYRSVISLRRRVPRVLVNRFRSRLHAIHLAREMVCNGEIECGWMERDVTPTKLRPAVPRRIDPPD